MLSGLRHAIEMFRAGDVGDDLSRRGFADASKRRMLGKVLHKTFRRFRQIVAHALGVELRSILGIAFPLARKRDQLALAHAEWPTKTHTIAVVANKCAGGELGAGEENSIDRATDTITHGVDLLSWRPHERTIAGRHR